ncbi:MAG TPA: sulfotransferase [Rhodanobacteraceae bacterium]
MNRSIEQRWQRALGYLARMESAPAHAQLEAMCTQAPDDVRTHLLASQIAWLDDHIRVATQEALAACRVTPDDAALLASTCEALLQVGEVVAARACMERLASADSPPWMLLRMADFRQRLHENSISQKLIERAMSSGATDVNTMFHHGVQLYFHGRTAEADAALRACLQAEPERGRAAYTLSSLRTQTPASNHLGQLEKGLSRVAPGSASHAALEFARYKELEDLGHYEEAWRALAAGNAIMHRRTPCTYSDIAYFDDLIAATRGNMLEISNDTHAGPQPIFIIGLPRSGTTVLERMLGNHPDVEPAGELVDFGAQLQWMANTRITHVSSFPGQLAKIDYSELGRRYLAQTQWRARGSAFFIDKQPSNWEMAGLIHAALPEARILHLMRDPMDVCFSNWRAFFGEVHGYSYDLEALAAHYLAYRRVMDHWHATLPGVVLDVAYTELVANPEPVLRKVFAHCGLEWTPGCSAMARNTTPVATLSAAQVREPLRNRDGSWRHYATQLEPLRHALGSA